MLVGDTVGRSVVFGVSVLASTLDVSMKDGAPPSFGWIGLFATGFLLVKYIIDQRKIAAAATTDRIIEGKGEMIKHLEEALEKCEALLARSEDSCLHFQTQFEECRNVIHDLRTDLNVYTAQNYSMRTLLIEKGIPLPFGDGHKVASMAYSLQKKNEESKPKS